MARTVYLTIQIAKYDPRVSSAPVYDSQGAIVAAVAVGRDVSTQQDGDSASLSGGL